MKLLTYIDIRMTAATGSGEKSLAKFRQLRAELERLYGDSTPLLALISPKWIAAPPAPKWGSYKDVTEDAERAPLPPSGGMADAAGTPLEGTFVASGQLPHLGAGGADLLRRLARSAIRDGFLPNVDAFPADEERVRGAYAVSGPDMKREFDRLLRFVNARAGRLTAAERSLLPYLYALLAGCELDDLWRADVPRVDGLGEDLRTLYNGPRYAGEELFNLKVKPDETPDQALQTLKRTLQKTLSANDITLFRDRSAITDRLAIAVSAGAPAAAVMAVADKVVAGEPYAEEMRALDRWVRDDHGYLKKYWRVLCSYSPRLNAEKMQTRVRGMRAELPEDVEFGEVKTYLPHETVVRARRGKVAPRVRPVMGRYLFVRSSLSDCQTLERYLADASFLRCTDRPQRRAVISEGELRRLMSFMKDYGDDLDVVDMAQWARDHEVNLKDGQRVRIENGPYAGYEGVIIQTKRRPDASGATKLFVVQVAGLPNLAIAGNVTARLRGLELSPL